MRYYSPALLGAISLRGAVVDGFIINQDLGRMVLLTDIATSHGSFLIAVGQSGGPVGLLRRDFILFSFIFVVASLVLLDVVKQVVLQDPQDKEEPEQIHRLQGCKQSKCDVLTDPTLVLLCLPVQLERTHGAEFRQGSPQDLEVDVVAQIYPHSDEEAKVRANDDRVQVVQCLRRLHAKENNKSVPAIFHDTSGDTYREEEVRDIVCDIYRQAHIRKVESVAQSDKRKGDDMVTNELLEVLARLLQLQHQNNGLLRPVTRLEKIIRLENSSVLPVRKALKHSRGVEVPDIRLAHDIETKRAKNRKVHGRVDLLHEAGHLALAADSTPLSPGANQTLHEELPSEGQHNGIESYERDILLSLAIHDRAARVLGVLRVG